MGRDYLVATLTEACQRGDWTFDFGGSGRWDGYVVANGEHDSRVETWPADSGWPLRKPVTVVTQSGSSEPVTSGMDPNLPMESAEVTVNTHGTSTSDSYTRSAHTQVKLWTGTTGDPSHRKLFCISAAAFKALDKKWRYDTGSPLPLDDEETIPPTSIEIGTLGKLGADGNLWVTLPDKTSVDITPRVKGVDYYYVNPSQQKYRLWVCANGNLTAPSHVGPDAKFCVGQQVTFSPLWMPSTPPFTSATYLWSPPDKFVNHSWQLMTPPGGPQPPVGYGSVNYDIDFELLTHETTQCWFVNTPAPNQPVGTVKLGVGLTFPNGQHVPVSAGGEISLYRPALAKWDPEYEGTPAFSIHSGELVLGGSAPQMSFRHYVQSEFSGIAGYTQLISGEFDSDLVAATDGYELDNTEWARPQVTVASVGSWTQNGVPFDDGPYVGLKFFMSREAIDVHFKTFLRFRPDAGQQSANIFVTLRLVAWSASASATQSGGVWSVDAGSLITGPNEGDSDELPVWTEAFDNSGL